MCACVPVDWLCNQCHRLLSITKDTVEVAVEIKDSVSLYGQRRPAVDLRDKSLSRPRTADAVAAAGGSRGGSSLIFLPSSKYRENTSCLLHSKSQIALVTTQKSQIGSLTEP